MWGWIKDAAKSAWNFVRGVGSTVVQIIKSIINRIIGILDFILTLFGIMPKKKIRVEAMILLKDRKPVADRAALRAALDLADEVFRDQMKVRIVDGEPKGPHLIPEEAPERNLSVACGGGAFASIFSSVGAWFRAHQARTPSGTFFGYGAPVTVFAVEDVEGKRGCSPWFFSDYVVIDSEALSGTEGSRLTLAHEVGHACSLPHAGGYKTLMRADWEGRPRRLTRLQKAIFRSSGHVTYL